MGMRIRNLLRIAHSRLLKKMKRNIEHGKEGGSGSRCFLYRYRWIGDEGWGMTHQNQDSNFSITPAPAHRVLELYLLWSSGLKHFPLFYLLYWFIGGLGFTVCMIDIRYRELSKALISWMGWWWLSYYNMDNFTFTLQHSWYNRFAYC
jgi:hypothetical protein